MKRSLQFLAIVITVLGLSSIGTIAQAQQVSGQVTDLNSGEPLAGVNVLVKNTFTGTTTDNEGNFQIRPNFASGPVTLRFSYIGYRTFEVDISEADATESLNVQMEAQQIMSQGVIVSATRRPETLMEAPVQVTRLDMQQVRDLTSPDLYTSLSHLQGVDLNTSSMLFTTINTRGFNSAKPERIIQLNDYVDMQIPSLNFAAGNLNGVPELDIESVEIIHGPASALYGANAFNGVINIISKDPFVHQGISAMVRGGERDLFEGSIRIAETFLDNRLAFKVNGSYFRANDWRATNLNPHSRNIEPNQYPPGAPDSYDPSQAVTGYNAVNRYGDIALNFAELLEGSDFEQYGDVIGRVYMPGYTELELIPDNVAENVKLNGSIHYLLTDNLKAMYEYKYASGSATYQSTSRYRFQDFALHTHRFELSTNNFMFRAYTVGDDSGETYDLNFTGINLSYDRVERFVTNYTATFASRYNQTDDINLAHEAARRSASNFLLQPGTNAFDAAFDRITSNPDNFVGGGSGFAVGSRINHAETQYDFDIDDYADVTVGGSFRQFDLNSNGTLFEDPPDESITNYEYGAYAQVVSGFLDDKLRLTIGGRLDGFQNFDIYFSPRASLVYSLGADRQHNFRVSWQNAFRSPTQLDQYIQLDIGPLILYGNIGDGFDGYTIPSTQAFDASSDPSVLQAVSISPLKVEQVNTFELGYKGIIAQDLFADITFYTSEYTDFIGSTRFWGQGSGEQLSIPELAEDLQRPEADRLSRPTQVWTNASQNVTAYGASIGLNYYFIRELNFMGTYTYSYLDTENLTDPIIPAFNTPEHKYSLGVNGSPFQNFNYSVNYKWVEGHEYEMPFAEGFIETYWTLDAQVNYRLPEYYTTLKIGGQNLTDNRYIQTYASPELGRLIYAAITVEL